jgi:pRiA4b ORF-3-like protein
MPSAPGQTVFQLRIDLNEVTPAVWRRLLVPGGIRLAKLHQILQAAMGWTDSHLHAFAIGDDRYGMHLGDDFLDEDLELLDEADITVVRVLAGCEAFGYEYDFGDGWEHQVSVADQFSHRYGLKYAVCLDGANACPPEDCGGPGGYEDLLVALADPEHEEHDDLLEWFGGPIDPTAFDIAATNVALQRVR